MKKEWWTVNGAFYGIKTFDNEEEAQQYFNDHVINDSWASSGSIVHNQIIATHEKLRG